MQNQQVDPDVCVWQGQLLATLTYCNGERRCTGQGAHSRGGGKVGSAAEYVLRKLKQRGKEKQECGVAMRMEFGNGQPRLSKLPQANRGLFCKPCMWWG